MAQSRRSANTLPTRTSSLPRGASLSFSRLSNGAKKAVLSPPPPKSKQGRDSLDDPEQKINILSAPIYSRMQNVVQQMLHCDHGVPIKSHKRRLISAIPSAFTGADMVTWLTKNLSIQCKAEAIHLANLLCHHGYFFCIEGINIQVKDDNTLFRFQTPYYWPSQNPDVSDLAYGVYLVKQVLRSKHRIRLLDYELKNLHKLKLRLAKEWKTITGKADDDVKVFREQKRVARAIISSQEEAFWRLYRPPPGESSVQDSGLTRHSTQRMPARNQPAMGWTEQLLREEVEFLRESNKRTRWKVSTAVENLQSFCEKYQEHDPMLVSPSPSNPWITGDTTLWTLDKSLIEHPPELQVKKWALSFYDLLNDVTGRHKFESYCKSQFNHENIRFWQACRDLKSLPLGAVGGSVKLIYDEFLERGAASEVNVSAGVQEEAERDLENPSRYSFSGAQEEIYKLMQNDIYPRFLKSSEYQEMLRKGREVDEAGKGFFSKLQKKKVELVKQDASGISPCLPQRYTKRQLSISRKMSATQSNSLDNIFLACGPQSPKRNPFAVEQKRNSTYTEAFIDSLMSPNPAKINDPHLRHRRVSAPDPPPVLSPNVSGVPLDNIDEGNLAGVYTGKGGMETGMPMSYSADDMQQLMDDADEIGPLKWKKFGLAAGMEFNQLETLSPEGATALSVMPKPQRSLSDMPFPQVPDHHPLLELASSPRAQGSYEFENLAMDKGLMMEASTESVQSTSSQ